MKLTGEEQSMLDGKDGKARQKAMELLVRYGEALGAERLVATDNIAGVPGSSNPFLQKYYGHHSSSQHGGSSYDAIFSLFDLDSDEIVEVPKASAHTCHLQGGYDPDNWQLLGATPETFKISQESEAYIADRGVKILKTCTPYLAGNVPKIGDHCAWMESSAVVYCNSVIGARTNTEGRESTSAAMLTGKIPDWGFHRDENRLGSHLIEVDFEIESVMDWGMLGYFVGEVVQERIPVLNGRFKADLIRHKHFGAAAASSGGVEMYHIAGVTPEAQSVAAAFGGRKPVDIIEYGLAEKRRTYDNLNSKAKDSEVDYVMLGCPHYSLEQIQGAVAMLEGKHVSANTQLWVFTSRAVKAVADAQGLSKRLRDAGAVLVTDTCSSIAQAVPPGTKVAALDSAKQTHYLPAIMNIQAWFGTTQDCINAAVTGRWNGVRP
jgi:predicted aconitase